MSYGQDQSQGYGQNAMVPAGGGGGLQAPAFSHANYKITRPWLSILGRKFFVYAPDGSLTAYVKKPVFKLKQEFTIFADDYVTDDSGTGIVHQAPGFGEDDFRVMKANGVTAVPCPVDMEGKFTSEVTDYAGVYVKDADKLIKTADEIFHVLVLSAPHPRAGRAGPTSSCGWWRGGPFIGSRHQKTSSSARSAA